jgi:hypothetical protein
MGRSPFERFEKIVFPNNAVSVLLRGAAKPVVNFTESCMKVLNPESLLR